MAMMDAKIHLSLVSPLTSACLLVPILVLQISTLLFLSVQLCVETEYLKLSGLRGGKLLIFI